MAKGAAERQAYVEVQKGIKDFKDEVAIVTERLKQDTLKMKDDLNSDDNAKYMSEEIEKFLVKMYSLVDEAAAQEKFWENRRKSIFNED